MATTGTWVPFGNRYAFENRTSDQFIDIITALFELNDTDNMLMLDVEIYGESITITREELFDFGYENGREDILDRLFDDYGIGEDETITGIVTSGYFISVG